MGKQLAMFPQPPTADDRLNAAQAAMRRDQSLREETRPGALTYQHQRRRAVKAKTLSVRRITRRELEVGRVLFPELEHAEVARPQRREHCAGIPRPCPFVSCRHNLYLDVSARGAIKLNFPDLEPHELPPHKSCALDVADAGGATLEEVAGHMNITRERVRQVAVRALAQIEDKPEVHELRDAYNLRDTGGRRRLELIDREPYVPFDPDEFAGEGLDDDGPDERLRWSGVVGRTEPSKWEDATEAEEAVDGSTSLP